MCYVWSRCSLDNLKAHLTCIHCFNGAPVSRDEGGGQGGVGTSGSDADKCILVGLSFFMLKSAVSSCQVA